jgi:hypothetical protein
MKNEKTKIGENEEKIIHKKKIQRDEEKIVDKENEIKKTQKKKKNEFSSLTYVLVLLTVSVMVFNQYQISNIYSETGLTRSLSGSARFSDGMDLSSVDLSTIKGTGYSLASLFPLGEVETVQDAINVLIPTGTPEYGEELGVSYDDPVNSLNFMAGQLWSSMRTYKTTEPELWNRYVNLASKPVGISCEYCCGLGAIGIRPDGESGCGCQHNPALLGLTVWLMKNTDMSDVEILKETLRWKTLFFPKNMVGLAIEVAGKDPSALGELPGMVGGC